MSLIKELFEAANNQPIELKDLVASYPKNFAKALHAVWSTRLHYQGKPWEQFYSSISDVGEDFIKQSKGYFTKDFDIVGEIDGKYESESFEVELEIDSCQEVYMGFKQSNPDTVYLGFDVWMNDEDIWQDFYRAFKKTFGVRYDEDIEDHEAIADLFWKEQVVDHQSFGVLLKIDCKNGASRKISVALDTNQIAGGGIFYRKLYRSPEFKELGLTDVRLD